MSTSLRFLLCAVVVSSSILGIFYWIILQRSVDEVVLTTTTTGTALISPGVISEPVVLSLDYWEQSANALNSLLQLQCWASSVSISKVIEPSVTARHSSVFHYVLKANCHSKFRDYYNISTWNNISSMLNVSTLVPVEYFLHNASKTVVFVKYLYSQSAKCPSMRSLMKTRPYLYRHLVDNKFYIDRIVCIAGKLMTEDEFNSQIFLGQSRNVTVIFDLWQGIRNSSSRISLKNSNCSGKELSNRLNGIHISHFKTRFFPSNRLLKHLEVFKTKYHFTDRYIVIMVRTEILNTKITSDKGSCINRILSDWRNMSAYSNTTKTLLFSDVGKHGSLMWNNLNARKFVRYLGKSLQLKMSSYAVNSALEDVINSNDSIEIALLQSMLASHATCIIMVGGGSFQGQTLNAYLNAHYGHKNCSSLRNRDCISNR